MISPGRLGWLRGMYMQGAKFSIQEVGELLEAIKDQEQLVLALREAKERAEVKMIELYEKLDHKHGYYDCVPKKDARELETLNQKCWDAIMGLKRGTCWCEMGIGNPMVKTHSKDCLQILELFKTVLPDHLAERIWSPQL